MDASAPRAEAVALQREHLEKLAAEGHRVMEVTYTKVQEPWSSLRCREAMETLVKRVVSFPPDTPDFCIRKTCLEENPEWLEFQRRHPKLYHMATDRALIVQPKIQMVLNGMLLLRAKVENGEVPEGEAADALATRHVLSTLSDGKVTGVVPAAPPGAPAPR